MNLKNLIRAAILLPCCVLSAAQAASSSDQIIWKPNKVLLVVGSQWADPNSDIIDGRLTFPHHAADDKSASPASGDTFWRTAAFLKTCGIPFDILRLDQMELRANYFLDHHLHPAYGAVIWDVDAESIPARDYEALQRLVTKHDLSLIVLTDRRPPAPVQALLGLQWDDKPARPIPPRIASPSNTTSRAAPRSTKRPRPRRRITAARP